MKVLFVLLIVAAVSQAVKIVWDNLEINPPLPLLRFGNGRITGGEEAKPHQFPYQAGLILTYSDGQQSFCGGSLISPDSVLTAAHCVDGIKSIEVILGAHRVLAAETSQVHLTSTNFTIHPTWGSGSSGEIGDIAIVKLPQAVELNENINIVKLPSRSDRFRLLINKIATVSGWGKDSDASTSITEALKFTSNPVISNLKCSLSYPPKIINPSLVCVTGRKGKSACHGDSGGPLVVTVHGVTKQIGLVTFGHLDGCELGYPAVYTRLTSYLDWIAQNAGITIEK